MLDIVTVKFEANKSRSNCLSRDVRLRVGDRCVVTTKRGVELGLVVDSRPAGKLDLNRFKNHKALRRATERDLYLQEKKRDQEIQARDLCTKLIKSQKLKMKLSGVEYLFDGSRVVFYFTAADRVDFRELVTNLARRLRARIEMRQIGARDEAKLIGCLGSCGLGENCSARFLKELKSVSVKIVRNQGLAVNPSRLSGNCGRLKCCLNYEKDNN